MGDFAKYSGTGDELQRLGTENVDHIEIIQGAASAKYGSDAIGGCYVPAKDFLLEAFYTFGAKGIGKRDTLYGSENFTLGDYTRIQGTFKF